MQHQQPQHHPLLPLPAPAAPPHAGGFELEEALFSTAPVGLHCADAHGVVLWANRLGLQFLGFDPDHQREEYVGHRVASFVYSDKVPAAASASTADAATARDDGGVAPPRADDGERRQGGMGADVNLITADDRTLYQEVLKRVVGGNPVSDIPVRFVTRSGTVVHLLLDCDGNAIPQRRGRGRGHGHDLGEGGHGHGPVAPLCDYYRFFTRDDTSRRISEMRANVLFQETNRSLQMLDDFMNRSMQQMRAPLTLMERVCRLVAEEIEDIDEAVGGTAGGGGAAAGEGDGDGGRAVPDLPVALSATREARAVVGLASALTRDALALVDDITDLCRFDQGRVLLIEKEAVKVRDLCLEALLKVPVPVGANLAGAGRVDVVLDVAEGAPGRTVTDRGVLQRSLALLLGFAADAAANAAAALDRPGEAAPANGQVILSVTDAAAGQPRGSCKPACKISVFYTNPPAAGAGAAPAEASAAAFASAYHRDGAPGRPVAAAGGFGAGEGPPDGPPGAFGGGRADPGSGGSVVRRVRQRESIQGGLASCRRDKLGLGLSLLYHLVGAQGSDLRYEIVGGGETACGTALPSMTKFWFLLPVSLDFPDRLPAERIVKDDLQQAGQPSVSLPNISSRPRMLSPPPIPENNNIQQLQQPRQKRARISQQQQQPDSSTDALNLGLSAGVIGSTAIGTASLYNHHARSMSAAAAPPVAGDSIANEPTKPSPATKQYPGVAPGARPLVLVVEDTDVSASLLCMHLRKLNCTSHRAENGEVAIEMLRAAPTPNMYSLILMDLRMPVLDGFEATKIIKGSNASNIPVVALTGETSEANRQRCDEIGFDDYKTKPLKRPQLQELLNKLVPGYTAVG